MLTVTVPTKELLNDLGNIDDIEIVEWDMREASPRERIDMVVAPYLEGPEVLDAIHGIDVGLVQWQSIGFDGVVDHLPDDVVFANATTVHETSTAELTLALVLAMQRGLPDFVRNADVGQWIPQAYPSLADSRVLLIGYGEVARAIESRLEPCEVHIVRLARRAREVEGPTGKPLTVLGREALMSELARADIVILATPLTSETLGLMDSSRLAAMKDGSLLVNVSRGAVVQTDALVAELKSGRIRAALDVVDPEPLPQDHPLWSLRNVLISPHVGGRSSAMRPRMARLIRRQIAHLKNGEKPENVISIHG